MLSHKMPKLRTICRATIPENNLRTNWNRFSTTEARKKKAHQDGRRGGDTSSVQCSTGGRDVAAMEVSPKEWRVQYPHQAYQPQRRALALARGADITKTYVQESLGTMGNCALKGFVQREQFENYMDHTQSRYTDWIWGCARGEGICWSLFQWGGITSGHHFLPLYHGLFCFVIQQNMLAGAPSGSLLTY